MIWTKAGNIWLELYVNGRSHTEHILYDYANVSEYFVTTMLT